MDSRDTNHRKPMPTSPRPGRPQQHPRDRKDWLTRDLRSPQLGLRDADVVRELTELSR
jgi:hypothetical protein